MLKPLTSQMCASLNVSKKSHNKTKVSRESKKQRNKEAKKSSETDKQRTSNIKEAGIIGKRLFPCFSICCYSMTDKDLSIKLTENGYTFPKFSMRESKF